MLIQMAIAIQLAITVVLPQPGHEHTRINPCVAFLNRRLWQRNRRRCDSGVNVAIWYKNAGGIGQRADRVGQRTQGHNSSAGGLQGLDPAVAKRAGVTPDHVVRPA